jgi:hypothetical protein
VAYRDAKGRLHSSLEKATLEDLVAVLGRVGDEGGMTSGVARMIFDKRSEIRESLPNTTRCWHLLQVPWQRRMPPVSPKLHHSRRERRNALMKVLQQAVWLNPAGRFQG